MWPLEPEQERLIRQLGQLIARGGAWRFLHGPVVAASAKDYPDKWEENRDGVARALARTLWHAHLDVPCTLVDLRAPRRETRVQLRKTAIELVRADPTGIEIALAAIGNDSVAGLLATEVGRAYVARLPDDHPLRGSAALPDLATGTIAAVYLGLGVVATNASWYARNFSEIRGRTAYSEHEIDKIGGLEPDDIALLLAVQATVRDDVLPALDTLAATHADAVGAWCDALDGHDDDLLKLLGITEVDGEPERPAEPRPVAIEAEWAEADLTKHNIGGRVYRYPDKPRFAYGFVASLAGLLLAVPALFWLNTMAILAIGPAITFVIGFIVGGRGEHLRCTGCGCYLDASATDCRLCGGKIAGDVKSPREAWERDN